MAFFTITLDTYIQTPTITAPGVISLGEPYVFIVETIEPINIANSTIEIVYSNGTRVVPPLFYSANRMRVTGEFDSKDIVGKSATLEMTLYDDYFNEVTALSSLTILSIYSLLMQLEFLPYGDEIDFKHYGDEIEIIESTTEMEISEQKEEIEITALLNSEIVILGTYSAKSIYSAVGGRRR